MSTAMALVVVNLRLYFRDRTRVVMSLLTSIILLVIYALSSRPMQTDNVRSNYPEADAGAVEWFVAAWVFAAIVMVTTVSTGFAALDTYVNDRVTGRFKDFQVSPLRPWQLVFGYMASAVIVATLMSTVVLAIGVIGAPLVYDNAFPVSGVQQAFGLIVLSSAAFAALFSFIVTFFTTLGSYSSFSTVVGTLIGFVAGAYVPLGMFSHTAASVDNVMPFSPAAMLFRDPLAGSALDAMAPTGVNGEVRDFLGFDIYIGSHQVEPSWAILALAAITIVFFALSARRMKRTLR